MMLALDALRAGPLLTTALIAIREDLWPSRSQYSLIRQLRIPDFEKVLSYTHTILNLE